MAELTDQEQKALDKFERIMDLLIVPGEGHPLPTHRKWTLPELDKYALADKPKVVEVAQSKAQQDLTRSNLQQGQETKGAEASAKRLDEGPSKPIGRR